MFKQKLGQVNPINLTLFQEVEREISFRTECGLYYSYYKQMLQAPTLMQGNDNQQSYLGSAAFFLIFQPKYASALIHFKCFIGLV